jgi:hypothetical protein
MGAVANEEVATAEMELNSIINLDRGIGVDSLSAMIPILQGQLMLIRRKWSEADQHYARAIPEASTYGPLRWEPRFLAERSQCLAMMGRADEAESLASKAIGQLSDVMHFDDIAACHARVALAYRSLGHSDRARDHSRAAEQYVAKLLELQAQQRRDVEPFLARLQPS